MIYQKLIFVLLFVALPFVGLLAKSGPVISVSDSIPINADQQKLVEIEDKLTRSPHYKNRNAAGRNAVFSRTAPTAKEPAQKQLTGPSYKNRKPKPAATDTVTPAPRTRLIGPRYKNRGAKSRRSSR